MTMKFVNFKWQRLYVGGRCYIIMQWEFGLLFQGVDMFFLYFSESNYLKIFFALHFFSFCLYTPKFIHNSVKI